MVNIRKGKRNKRKKAVDAGYTFHYRRLEAISKNLGKCVNFYDITRNYPLTEYFWNLKQKLDKIKDDTWKLDLTDSQKDAIKANIETIEGDDNG